MKDSSTNQQQERKPHVGMSKFSSAYRHQLCHVTGMVSPIVMSVMIRFDRSKVMFFNVIRDIEIPPTGNIEFRGGFMDLRDRKGIMWDV